MKKCLLINNAYPSLLYPNCSTYTKSIEDCISESGYDVELLVIKYNRQITRLYKILKYFHFWFKLFVTNINKYDLVYLNIPPFAWTYFLNPTFHKKKTINHWHGDEVTYNSCFLRIIRPFVAKRTRECKHIVPSNYFKTILSKSLDIDGSNIYISPSGGIDINAFSNSEYMHNSVFKIGFSSGMSYRKGADLLMSLVDASEEIEKIINKKLEFKIIDYGSEMHLYKNRLVDNCRVSLIPCMSKEQMPIFYKSIDILLMGSFISEALGLVVLEAMSCGKPVICYNLFAFPEFVIPGETGELVTFSKNINDNINGFINAIKTIVNNYNNYNPRDLVVKKYSKDFVTNQYKEIL